jgi:hypothetical protein
MDLQQVIDKAATRFATDVMEAIRSVPLSELLASRPDAAPVAAKKRGRPAKKMTVKLAKKIAAKLPKTKRSYPKCSVSGCKNTMWARGEGMCGMHFKEAQAAVKVVAKPTVAKKPKAAKKAKPPKTPKVKAPKKVKKAAPKKEAAPKMAPMGRDAAIAKNAAAETPKA